MVRGSPDRPKKKRVRLVKAHPALNLRRRNRQAFHLQVRIVGPEVLEHDDGIGQGGIGDRNALPGGPLRDEELVVRELAEADHRRGLDVPDAHHAVTLHHDHAVSGAVLDRHGSARLDRQLLGAERGGLVADPILRETLPGHLIRRIDRLGLHEPVLHEIRIDVEFPIDHAEQPVDLALLVLGRVLPQQLFGHDLVVGHVLVHRKDVRGLLRFVGAQAARRVKHARRDVPSGPGVQPVGRRQRRDRVVSALGGVQQRLADLVLRHAGIETEECVGEVAAVVVGLRRKVIGLRLAQLAGELGVLIPMMDMVRQCALVVEELRVHRPAAMLLPEAISDDLALEFSMASRSRTCWTLSPSRDDEAEPSLGEVSGPLSAGSSRRTTARRCHPARRRGRNNHPDAA